MKMTVTLCLLGTLLWMAGCQNNSKMPPATTPLLDANSLKGWKTVNEGGQWTIKDGELFGTKSADINHHCLLVTEESFSDFTLKLEFKAIKGDSGFYFRLKPTDKNGLGFEGYHAEIQSSGKNAGGLYDVAVDWIAKPDPAIVTQAFKPSDWNQMMIKAYGKGISVWINGYKMTEIQGHRTLEGQFGIQLHAGDNTQIKFRNITISR